MVVSLVCVYSLRNINLSLLPLTTLSLGFSCLLIAIMKIRDVGAERRYLEQERKKQDRDRQE